MTESAYKTNFSAAQLDSVEQMAYLLFTPELIAVNLEIDKDLFMDHLRVDGSDIHKAFYKGYIRQQVELRSSIVSAAQNGSNPAQETLLKFLHQLNTLL